MTEENHSILTFSEVLDKLQRKEWFKNTDEGIQTALLTLPEDFLGFLTDLVNRPDELSYSEITRMLDLKFGKFLLLPVFEVRSTETNQVSTYEYAASKYGGQSRFRGLLLIEKKGKIEYFILAKTEKFPLARFVYEAIGGFIEYRNNKLENMPKNIEDSIKTQLGLSELKIKKFIDLGTIAPDSSTTDKEAALFAAIIDGTEATGLENIADKTMFTHKLGYKVEIIPISKLREYITQVEDSFFLAIILRLISLGVLKLS